MIQTEGIFVGGGAISAPIIGKDFNWTGGDGTYQVIDDDGGDWRIKFPYSGTFTPLKNMVIDAFLVGAGGLYSLRWRRRGLHHHGAVYRAGGQHLLFHCGRCGGYKRSLLWFRRHKWRHNFGIQRSGGGRKRLYNR